MVPVHRSFPSLLATVFVSLICLATSSAQETMTKIVFRDGGKGIEKGSFAEQPKTLYTLGKEKGRLEEALDSAQGLHGLVVVNGKDCWILNRVTKTGRHIIDPGPTNDFHVPLVPPTKEKEPPPFGDFEMGREIAFMTKHHVEPKTIQQDGKSLDHYEYAQDGYVLQLDVSQEKGTPVMICVVKDKVEVARLFYLEYVQSIPADPTLFVPPADFKISDD